MASSGVPPPVKGDESRSPTLLHRHDEIEESSVLADVEEGVADGIALSLKRKNAKAKHNKVFFTSNLRESNQIPYAAELQLIGCACGIYVCYFVYSILQERM